MRVGQVKESRWKAQIRLTDLAASVALVSIWSVLEMGSVRYVLTISTRMFLVSHRVRRVRLVNIRTVSTPSVTTTAKHHLSLLRRHLLQRQLLLVGSTSTHQQAT